MTKMASDIVIFLRLLLIFSMLYDLQGRNSSLFILNPNKNKKKSLVSLILRVTSKRHSIIYYF